MRTIYRFFFNKFADSPWLRCATQFIPNSCGEKKKGHKPRLVSHCICRHNFFLIQYYWFSFIQIPKQNFILDGNLNVKLLFFFSVPFHISLVPLTLIHTHTQSNECQTNDKTFNWNFKITCRSIFHSYIWHLTILHIMREDVDVRKCGRDSIFNAFHCFDSNHILNTQNKINFLLLFFFPRTNIHKITCFCNSWISHTNGTARVHGVCKKF